MLAALAAVLMTPALATAQGSFVPPQGQSHSTESNHWSPPNPAQRAPETDFNSQPQVTRALEFPKGSIPFDPHVRPATFESVDESSAAPGSSLDSSIDSTANMISNLKTTTSQQLTGIAAKFDKNGAWMDQAKTLLGSSDISRMLGSLTLVLGVYFTFVWLMRRFNPGSNSGIPSEVIEVMGQIPFGPKRELQLVRLGSKLLLLMSSPEGTHSIGEITDPDEVEYLTGLCPGKRQKKTGSYAAIRNAANRLAANRKPPTPTTHDPAAGNPNLANILRTLDQAAKQNTAVFEA